MTSDRPEPDQSDDVRGDDPGTESVVELDPSEVVEFLERVGHGAKDDEHGEHGEESGGGGDEGAAPRREDDDGSAAPPEIPGYEIFDVVGRGATGVVYRARQEAVDRPVALKVLHRELITNRRAVRRLQREARLAAKLAHPSIISAIDMGEIDGLWWYAMELCEGVPLSRRIAERGSLTEREILRLFSPLCDALQHAHEGGVVHRDIKPANVLIDGRGRARLVDLGLAMGQNDPSITRTGATLGTPHYVSPEQARDPSQADIRSDIWSVGATMYHAACGQPPFHAEAGEDGGVAEILSRVLYEPVVDPREFSPTLSKDFSLMLRKCLTRDPDQRYQEPWELVADIELLRERRRLDLRGSQLDPYASRRPAWVGRAIAAAALVIAVAGTWAITARPWEEPEAPVVVPTSRLGDWPELRAIDEGFTGGTLTHAAALAELESPALLSLPETARFHSSALVVRIKDDLDRTVRSGLDAAETLVDGALSDRAFARAELAATDRLDEGLREETGFTSVGELPEGRTRRAAEEWRRGQLDRVSETHDGVRRTAAAGLQAAYRKSVRPRVDELLAENRWADAWTLLSPTSPLDWLTLDGSSVDVRGLDADEQRDVVRAIDDVVRGDLSDVRYQASRAVEEASDFVDAERARLLDEIDQGRITGETTAAERLALAVDAKHRSLRLAVDQLPPEFAESYRSKLDVVTRDLDRVERQERQTAARRGLNDLEKAMNPLLTERRYGSARELLRVARAESWRASTFDILDARLREIDMLEDVLARAAVGIEAMHREQVELTFQHIPVRGRVQANGASTSRLGFVLRPGRPRPELRIVLRPSQLEGGAREEVLEADDLLRFAGLADEEGLTPADRLAAAAFLSAEGRPQDARLRIHLEEHDPDDPLPADLESRVRRRAETSSAEDAEDPRPNRAAEAAAPAAAPTFEEAYGVPNQTDIGRDVRLAWNFVDDGSDAGFTDLPIPLPEGVGRRGAWRSRGWSLVPEGYSLGASLRERADLLAGDVGPVLPLVEPLRTDQAIEVMVEFRPGDHRPDGHVVALSVRGYHVLLVGERLDQRVWFGTGDFKELIGHALDETGPLPRNFYERPFSGLRDDEPMTIELQIRDGTLDGLAVDGKRLVFPQMYKEPRLDDPTVRLRSDKPLTLLRAEVRGQRIARR